MTCPVREPSCANMSSNRLAVPCGVCEEQADKERAERWCLDHCDQDRCGCDGVKECLCEA